MDNTQNLSQIFTNFSEKIKDPIALKQLDLLQMDDKAGFPRIAWNDLALGSGYPGVLILCTVLEKAGYLSDGISHLYMLEIKKALENQGIDDLSLYRGLTGLCFAIEEASFEKTRYQSLLHQLQSCLIENVESFYLEPLSKNLKSKQPSSTSLYDPISGICGVGRYALENLSLSVFEDLSRKITKILIALTLPISIGPHSVPGWYVSPQDRVHAFQNKSMTNGNFNLGLAHGITGILAFLSIAYLKGIQLDGHKEAIQRISSWIQKHSFTFENGIHWPYSVSWEEVIEGKQKNYKIIKAGWCYGVPGIARTLFLAGKAINDEGIRDFALMSFEKLLDQSPKEWRLSSPCLCHGVAGLLFIAEAMSKEEEGKKFAPKIQKVQQELMKHYDKTSLWGFMDVEGSDDEILKNQIQKTNKISFLEGATGIFLTLLSNLTTTSKWHLPLMIYE